MASKKTADAKERPSEASAPVREGAQTERSASPSTAPKKPQKLERPSGGGAYVRDRKTGKLTRLDEESTAPADASTKVEA